MRLSMGYEWNVISSLAELGTVNRTELVDSGDNVLKVLDKYTIK